jgi:hypothetical protein
MTRHEFMSSRLHRYDCIIYEHAQKRIGSGSAFLARVEENAWVN